MKENFIVTIALTLAKDDSLNQAALSMLQRQSLEGVEILTPQTEECTWQFRNRAIQAGRGRYLFFLDTNTCFSSNHALEYVCRTALLEDTKVLVGRDSPQDDTGNGAEGFVDVTSEMLCEASEFHALYDRAWLCEKGLLFTAETREDDFVTCALAIATRVFTLGKAFAAREQNTSCSCVTFLEDTLGGLSYQLEVAHRFNVALLKESVVRAIFTTYRTQLSDVLWSGGECDTRRFVKAWLTRHAGNLGVEQVAEVFECPTVSVIVPAYNVEKYLARCLNSLLAQTLIPIEIICVDDGSTDDTALIADRYAEMNTKIKVIHQENGGRSAARNAGLSVATGRYIGFIDGDDWVEPVMFERMAEALDNHDDVEIAMCGAIVDYEYEVEQKEKDYANQYFVVPLKGAYDLTPAIIHDLNASVCTRLFRRRFLDENGIRFPFGMNNEDEVFSFFTMGRAKRIYFYQEKWYHYIRNASGIMAQQVKDSAEENVIPDALTKVFPLIAYYLEWDDRRDLLGVFWRHLCGASSRFSDNLEALQFISKLLHETRFYYRRDFLDSRDLGWVSNRLCELYNYNIEGVEWQAINAALLPTPCELKNEVLTEPILTFIVPVYNIEENLSYCIESLRKQTLREIEIIFIDDGSQDASLEILNYYQSIDSRIRVIVQENNGVAVARNRGIQEARGKYISFIDGDDWIDLRTAEVIVNHCEEKQLDICYFDFVCFDDRTRKSMTHWYSFANRKVDLPIAQVFSPVNLINWMFPGGPCTLFYRREFLIEHNFSFPLDLKIGEDFTFIMTLFPYVRRAYIEPSAFYHYRRGRASSAITTLSAGNKSEVANQQQVVLCDRLATLYQQKYLRETSVQVQKNFLQRAIIDVLFYAEKSEAVRRWIFEAGIAALRLNICTKDSLGGGLYTRLQKILALSEEENADTIVEEMASEANVKNGEANRLVGKYPPGTPYFARKRMARIEAARKTSSKDYYIVMGQLNSKTNEPIDSWTFFQWLQKHNVPSCYVMWKQHKCYKEFRKHKHVIGLSGNGVDGYEFIQKCHRELIRAKAVVAENGAINWQTGVWLHDLPNCEYVFLQHGLTFSNFSTVPWMTRHFNSINVASHREEESFLVNTPKENKVNLFIGGLPRMDILSDLSHEVHGEKVVFVMFTWRSSFNQGMERIKKSAWWNFLMALITEQNVARLKKTRTRFVLAMHHHIMNVVKNFEIPSTVEIVDVSQVSYWIRHAKMCITDFSSVSGDFLFLNKPVIYSLPDVQDILLDPAQIDDGAKVASAKKNLRTFPNLAKSVSEVMDLIEYYEARDFKMTDADKAFASSFFQYRKNICEAVYEGIERIASESEVTHV